MAITNIPSGTSLPEPATSALLLFGYAGYITYLLFKERITFTP